jgi:hypothetical protein
MAMNRQIPDVRLRSYQKEQKQYLTFFSFNNNKKKTKNKREKNHTAQNTT